MAKTDHQVLAAAIRALISDKGLLEVHVTPNARHSALQLPASGTPQILAVRTTATPEDGKANREVIALIAKALGIAKGKISVERGATARLKLLRIAV